MNKKKPFADFPGHANLNKYIDNVLYTGSYFTVTPAVTDTDIDVLCLVAFENLFAIMHVLKEENYDSIVFEKLIDKNKSSELEDFVFTKSVNDYNLPEFMSFRNGKYNLILTIDRQYFSKFKMATELSKALNIKDKKLRIDLFNCITRNTYPDYAAKLNAKPKPNDVNTTRIGITDEEDVF